MSFWGVYLKPNEAYTLLHNQNDPKILRITQATLGDAIRTSPARSTVNCSIGDKPEIAICSLIVPNLTCCQLELEFDESHDVIFSVKGPRGIHLAGYFVTPAADHLRVINDGNEVLNGDEVPEETQCGLLQENGDAIVKKKKEKKNKKKQASTIEPTASGYVSDTESEMLEARLTKQNSSTDALERSENKVKDKRKASTIEPTAIGNVSATEDNKFGSESRIINENGSSKALERGEDKEEKKKRKRKASTIEPTASGYVSPTEDDKFGSDLIINKENGSTKALKRGEDKEEKKNRKKKARTIEPTAIGYVSPTEDDKFGSDSIIIKENGSTKALERGEDKEEKKNRKKKASTKEPTASGYVSPTKDDKFGSDSIIIKENGSTKALERGEDKKEKKNTKRKARTIEPTASGYVNPTENDKFGSESIIIKENGSSNALEKSEDTAEKKKKKKMRKKSRSKHNLSNDNNPSTGDRNGDSPSLTIEGQLPEMSKTILVECEVKGAGAKSK